MTIYLSCNSKPKIDLVEIIDKNSLEDGLIRPMYKFTKSVIKIDSKMGQPNTYNKVINNLIYGNR